jgi:hypothetical protein
MKKLTQFLFIVVLLSGLIVGCGPSAEEKAAAEQHMKDSIAEVEKARADSMVAVQMKAMEDSIAMVKAIEDSLKAVAESAAAGKPKTQPKPKPKTETQPTKPEDVKPGQGRD